MVPRSKLAFWKSVHLGDGVGVSAPGGKSNKQQKKKRLKMGPSVLWGKKIKKAVLETKTRGSAGTLSQLVQELNSLIKYGVSVTGI